MFEKCLRTFFCVAVERRTRDGGSVEPVSGNRGEKEDARVFSNGINALLITRLERKIYLSSPGICDQGISASVLLRDEN